MALMPCISVFFSTSCACERDLEKTKAAELSLRRLATDPEAGEILRRGGVNYFTITTFCVSLNPSMLYLTT